MESASGKLIKRFYKLMTDRKFAIHFLRHWIKDGLRNTCYPEAISIAILGHGSNTVASNYSSVYALEVMRERMERVWN